MTMLTVRIGCNDLAAAIRFYDAVLAPVGIGPSAAPPEYPVGMYRSPGGPVLLVGAPRDGQAATPANGGTIGFAAPSAEAVDAFHAAGLAHGGTCEGAPGPREMAGGAYGAYLRDPDGNKICAYSGLSLG